MRANDSTIGPLPGEPALLRVNDPLLAGPRARFRSRTRREMIGIAGQRCIEREVGQCIGIGGDDRLPACASHRNGGRDLLDRDGIVALRIMTLRTTWQ